MKNLIKSAWGLVQENRRAYIIINVVYYGLVAICMVYVAFNQELQEQLLKMAGQAFMTGPLAVVGESYVNARVLTAILATGYSLATLCGSSRVILQ